MKSSGSSANNRLANTKERDSSLGLDNHGFRYYDPSTGRYISRDPIGYGDGLNVYIYVHNNPINHIDPLGLGEGHHIVGQALWNKKAFPDMNDEVRKIFSQCTLSSPAYEVKANGSHDWMAIDGIKPEKYNGAVSTLSQDLYGKLPHQLNVKEARGLVEQVLERTANSSEYADEASRLIGRYNGGVLSQIAKANANAARAERAAATLAAREGSAVGKAARAAGKVGKVIAPANIAYATVTGGAQAGAVVAFEMSPADDAYTIGKAVVTAGQAVSAAAQAFENTVDTESKMDPAQESKAALDRHERGDGLIPTPRRISDYK